MSQSIPQHQHHATDVPVITSDKGLNLIMEIVRRPIFNQDPTPLLAQWQALREAEKNGGASWLTR